MRALVTGGAGFIGSHIVEALLSQGSEVVAVDNLDPRVHGSPVDLPQGVQFQRGDILVERDLEQALSQPFDVIYHEAAMVGLGRGALDAEAYTTTNVVGTTRLLQAAHRKGRPRIVLASTMAVYGEGAYQCPTCKQPRPGVRATTELDEGRWEPQCLECHSQLTATACTEAQPFRPGTVYAVSKAGQEQMAFLFGQSHDMEVVALRYHNVYGPRMPRDTPYAGVASMFKSRLLAGKPPLVHEDGRQLRDFVHVSDVAKANLLAATRGQPGHAYNIGTGKPRPLWDLAQGLTNIMRADLQPQFSGTYRPGDARHVFADVTKAVHELGYAPSVSFEQGLKQFVSDPVRPAPQAPAQ